MFGSGTPSSSGASSSGQTASAGSLFGGTSSSKPLFGGTPAGGGSSLFSGLEANKATPDTGASTGGLTFGGLGGSKLAAGSSSPFGAQPASSSSATPSIFGTSAGGSNLFGPKTTTPAGNDNKAAPTFSFGTKPATNSSPSIFGTPAASSAAPAGSSTPAPKPFSLFNSTTPAGPPPASSAQSDKPAGSNLFGGSTGQTASPLFGAKPTAPTSTAGAAKPLFGAATTTPQNSASPFSLGGTSATPASQAPAAGTSTSAAPTSNLFSKTATTSAPTGVLFGGLGGSTPAASTSSTTPATTAPASGGLFGSLGTPKPAAPQTSSSGGLFGNLGGAPTSTNTSAAASTSTAPTSTAAPSNLFGNLGGGSATPASTAATSSSTPAASTAPAQAPAGGLFGAKPASTEAPKQSLFGAVGSKDTASSSSTTGPATTSTAAGTSGAGVGTSGTSTTGGPTLGGSTMGPTPQMSRLKNKTMDEIITRWASDLTKYQKDFQEQAAKVAAWDRLLVDNGDKIQKLYQKTFEAERETSEVERQLSNVESQQDELAGWLDRYEVDVDEMFARQVGANDSLQGPDQERERTYRLAEKLTDRLDDMGKNLASMIEAINDAGASLSKSNKADDPLAHIVRVLNDHLTQLQWIDQNATLLQAKVAEAQKQSQSIGSNGYGGLEDNAAEAFYRSYGGRR